MTHDALSWLALFYVAHQSLLLAMFIVAIGRVGDVLNGGAGVRARVDQGLMRPVTGEFG
ncbi:hypothetical protein [Sphaerotilus mobilis]|uniref:Uncharacterized protein n=1 Tax=Sphaerotilus mobilis TaxID=47994 RepID=A0A4Q7LFP8_9BURK|nr:hypothetical protein [Sphaerotilus mobilis]RZS52994.1 hypothetical protein EV685_2616 [Sphaerotilus mobilis]